MLVVLASPGGLPFLDLDVRLRDAQLGSLENLKSAGIHGRLLDGSLGNEGSIFFWLGWGQQVPSHRFEPHKTHGASGRRTPAAGSLHGPTLLHRDLQHGCSSTLWNIRRS